MALVVLRASANLCNLRNLRTNLFSGFSCKQVGYLLGSMRQVACATSLRTQPKSSEPKMPA